MSAQISKARKSKRTRNAIVRLLSAVLIILSIIWMLDNSGFFKAAVVYDPVSDISYHEASSPSGKPSYGGYGLVPSYTEGMDENNLSTFRDGITGPRTARTEIIGEGKDVFTVMIYMCGADAESLFGLASADIEEMKAATSSGKLNVIIQTGGAVDWNNSSVRARDCQRFKISGGKLTKLASGSNVNMTNYANLTSFVMFCRDNYKANRYALILWGNGGGTSAGYGYDEMNSSGDSLTIDEINQALSASGVSFDFIGFDSSFMATYDTAYVMNFYADYLIASQDVVPSTGWNYTGWLSAIADNTSIETTEIARIIIDDYTNACITESADNISTLSLIDLIDFNNLVHPAMNDFLIFIDELMNEGNYPYVANARAASKEFSDRSADIIDLMDFSDRIGTEKGDALTEALKVCIKYNSVSGNTVNANGLSLYFPFRNLENVNNVLNIFHRIGISGNYFDTARKFANICFGGRLQYSAADDLITGISQDVYDHFVKGSYSKSVEIRYKWVDNEFIRNCATYYANNTLPSDAFKIVTEVCNDGNSFNVFSLNAKQWHLVADVRTERYAFDPDTNSYISLGSDVPVFDYLNSDRLHLKLTDQYGSVSLNGIDLCAELCGVEIYGSAIRTAYRAPVYITTAAEEDSESFTYPAVLYIVKDNSGDYYDSNSIIYAARVYENGETPTASKTIQIKDGDLIAPRYEYLDAGLHSSDISVSDTDIISSSDSIEVSSQYESSGDDLTYYLFTDIYGNIFRVNTTGTAAEE